MVKRMGMGLALSLALGACQAARMGPAGDLGRGPDAAAMRIAAAGDQLLAVTKDGRLWEWGLHPLLNAANPQPDRPLPQAVPELTAVSAMAVSEEDPDGDSTAHLLAVRQDGTVWSWGDNDHGQRGPDAPASAVPAQVPGLGDVGQVETGCDFSIALKRDGTVWTWGRNDFGQLGDGTLTRRNQPAVVPGLKDVAAVRGGRRHVLALTRDGRVWSWGGNYAGQLGHGDLETVPQPKVVAALSGIASLAAGNDYSLALTQDGKVQAWGNTTFGQLGNGKQGRRHRALLPQAVPGLDQVAALAAGRSHVLALLKDGQVRSWGSNDLGELGRGTATFGAVSATPGPVDGLKDVTAVAAGRHLSLALDRRGQLWAWGNNYGGQLGQGKSAFAGQVTPGRVLAPTGGAAWELGQ